MGNTISRKSGRHCGLCYFRIDTNAPFLSNPTVSRRALPIYPASPWIEGLLDETFHPPQDSSLVEFKTQFQAFHDSASRGCSGCAAILQCLEHQCQAEGFIADQKTADASCEVQWNVGDRKASDHSATIRILAWSLVREKYIFIDLSFVIVYPGGKSPHPTARVVRPAISEAYTGSPVSMKNIKSWLVECDASHEDCKQPPFQLPDRVLQLHRDTQGDIQVTLVENLKTKEPYACLSHRWGPSTLRCRTLKDTLASHLHSIPFDKLLRTFQDACSVTLNLGLRYIWIDSLCIIQDDADDWKRQAAKMCSIYSGSYVTIAATCSNDSEEGLFRKIPKFHVHGQSSNIFIRGRPNHTFDKGSGLVDPPLLTRGWVYQERLLSPRVVHFAETELRFEDMRPEPLCECGSGTMWYRKQNHLRALAATDFDEIKNHWGRIVNHFSQLDLTYPSDCLPALAGVARQYGSVHKNLLGRYIAGLWENSLVYDLIWYINDGHKKHRPEGFDAPTWSWVSVPGSGADISRFSRMFEDLQVLDFNVELAGPDEYGPIKSADLTIQGCLIPGSWKWVTHENFPPDHHFYHGIQGETSYMRVDYDFSISGSSRHVEENSPIYCLKTGFVGDGCHICLVLRAMNEEKTVFERIGMMEAPKKLVDDWFRECTTSQIIRMI